MACKVGKVWYPYGVDPNRHYRVVHAQLEWLQLPWYKRLWEWVRP